MAMDEYYIYLDESGDFGWSFDQPYGKGGSSRYFTISGIVVCAEDKHRPERVIKRLREFYEKKHGVKIPVSDEIKATSLCAESKSKFCDLLMEEAKKAKFFKIFSITVNKQNVNSTIFKTDPNTLYNYMTKIGIVEKVCEHNKLTLIADQRVTSTELKHAFDTYLKTELAGTYNADAEIDIQHKSSHTCKKIQCADIATNLIWRSHEYSSEEYLETFNSIVIQRRLFF